MKKLTFLEKSGVLLLKKIFRKLKGGFKSHPHLQFNYKICKTKQCIFIKRKTNAKLKSYKSNLRPT